MRGERYVSAYCRWQVAWSLEPASLSERSVQVCVCVCVTRVWIIGRGGYIPIQRQEELTWKQVVKSTDSVWICVGVCEVLEIIKAFLHLACVLLRVTVCGNSSQQKRLNHPLYFPRSLLSLLPLPSSFTLATVFNLITRGKRRCYAA